MKTFWIAEQIKYSGEQLRPLYAYLSHEVLGPSIVSWRGPCDIPFSHMVDGEDLLAQETIAGSDMLHFIVEIFDQKLMTGVALQRLLAAIVREQLAIKVPKLAELRRSGDDLFWQDQKLSISIATVSQLSVLIHFAVNISTAGTPVKTCGLQDFAVEPVEFAKSVMSAFAKEYLDITEATHKVRSV